MITDPALYLPVLIIGAFAAAFVSGAIGFADALILNAVWLHIMEPAAAIPLVVTCGVFIHIAPLYKLRTVLDFSPLVPFIAFGFLAVPLGVWVLAYATPEIFRKAVAYLLIFYGVWMFVRPNTNVGNFGGRIADSVVGFGGGFMGGFAGLSGLLPTMWVGMRNWPRNRQRGVYQPFVVAMHFLGIIVFATKGMINERTLSDLLWCLPVVLIGSWLGVKVYPLLNDKLFKQIILALILLSGITLLI